MVCDLALMNDYCEKIRAWDGVTEVVRQRSSRNHDEFLWQTFINMTPENSRAVALFIGASGIFLKKFKIETGCRVFVAKSSVPYIHIQGEIPENVCRCIVMVKDHLNRVTAKKHNVSVMASKI